MFPAHSLLGAPPAWALTLEGPKPPKLPSCLIPSPPEVNLLVHIYIYISFHKSLLRGLVNQKRAAYKRGFTMGPGSHVSFQWEYPPAHPPAVQLRWQSRGSTLPRTEGAQHYPTQSMDGRDPRRVGNLKVGAGSMGVRAYQPGVPGRRRQPLPRPVCCLGWKGKRG